MDLRGATVVVTGGAIRVGRHVAGRLAERGANIVVNYRTSAREAEAAVAEFHRQGVGSLAVQADVSTHAGVQAILDAAISEFGSVEVLVNNASIYGPTPFDELDEADFDRNIAVNLKGPYLGMLAVWAAHAGAGAGQDRQRRRLGGGTPLRELRTLFRRQGRCRGAHPRHGQGAGARRPGERRGAGAYPDAGRLRPGDNSRGGASHAPRDASGDPEDIAQTILYLVEGTDFVTGAVIPVDGGRTVS